MTGSAAFGSIVLLLRAATLPAACTGVLICLVLLSASGGYSNLVALITVFVISFVATRVRRSHKESLEIAESRRGRRTSQIVANLGAAALFAATGHHAGCIASLAEAAADTASSEIGQTLSGQPRLITSWKPVLPGTDGAVSIGGTIAGLLAALIVTLVGAGLRRPLEFVAIFLCASFGLFVDSLLGATFERWGRLGNDLVNFLSTIAAGLLAVLLTQ